MRTIEAVFVGGVNKVRNDFAIRRFIKAHEITEEKTPLALRAAYGLRNFSNRVVDRLEYWIDGDIGATKKLGDFVRGELEGICKKHAREEKYMAMAEQSGSWNFTKREPVEKTMLVYDARASMRGRLNWEIMAFDIYVNFISERKYHREGNIYSIEKKPKRIKIGKTRVNVLHRRRDIFRKHIRQYISKKALKELAPEKRKTKIVEKRDEKLLLTVEINAVAKRIYVIRHEFPQAEDGKKLMQEFRINDVQRALEAVEKEINAQNPYLPYADSLFEGIDVSRLDW